MDPGRRSLRRTCTSCRKWFQAEAAATRTQKTCSLACRAKRRAMLARQRRERSLHESRVADRKRQQACRARRRRDLVEPPRRAMSRATLSPQAIEMQAQVMAIVDHAARLSRATLGRQLRGILGAKGSAVDQAGA